MACSKAYFVEELVNRTTGRITYLLFAHALPRSVLPRAIGGASTPLYRGQQLTRFEGVYLGTWEDLEECMDRLDGRGFKPHRYMEAHEWDLIP